MKTYKNLYPQICDYRNIWQAWRKARRGKRYRPTVAEFAMNLDVELQTLREELETETYQPSGYRHFTVHEPKKRKISAAPFRDRVVHHALCNIIEPIYERKFIYDSYANRKGKGTHKALDRCTYYMRRYRYVLQCDVQQFFPAIDHAILKSILERTLADAKLLRLCAKIMDSGAGVLRHDYQMRWFAGDDLLAIERPRGLPIGNLTSQFWANVYLNPFDQWIKHDLKVGGYVRYVDDFLLFADDLKTLHGWRSAVIEFLAGLRLTIHENRAQPRPVSSGIPFLGFTVYPDHRRLKRTKALHFRRKILWQKRRVEAGELEASKLDASLTAWFGHIRHGDTFGLKGKLLESL